MPPSDKPGANSRGRGGKFRKFTRGGGKQFSRDLRPVDSDGNPISMWSEDAQKQFGDGSDEDSEEDSEEDSDEGGAGGAAKGEPSRADRKQDKKARKEAAIKKKAAQSVEVGDLPSSSEEDSDDDMPANPNHSKAARSMAKAAVTPASADVDEAAEGVGKLAVTANRKERESLEAQQAKERYQKLHAQGKTDEAKADMARLKLIREQREAEAARRQAEKEEREAQETARKAEIDAKEAKKREAALGAKKSGKKAK